jgi:hypothetical protein
MNAFARLVAAASLAMEMDEVLVARMASSLDAASASRRIFSFNASFSVAASMTKSQLPSASYSVVPRMRASAESRSVCRQPRFLQ